MINLSMNATERAELRAKAKLVMDGWHESFREAAKDVARDYLALTDPTPLTVELLVQLGFVANGEDNRYGFKFYHRGEFQCRVWASGGLEFYHMHGAVNPDPRTVGELNMLFKLMENR